MRCAVRHGLYSVKKDFCGEFCHIFSRLTYPRHRRLQKVHIRVIVERYDRNILRNLQRRFPYCLECSEGNGVAEGENCSRRVCGFEKKLGLEVAVLDGKLVTDNPYVLIESLFHHGFPIASDSFLARIGRDGALDAGYLPVSHSDKVPCRHKTTLMVVCRDEAQVGVIVITVDEHYWKIVVIDALDQGIICSAWHCYDSVNSPGKEKGCAVIEVLFVFHRVDYDGCESSAVDFADDDACNICEVGVCYRRQEQTDSVGPVGAQTLRN